MCLLVYDIWKNMSVFKFLRKSILKEFFSTCQNLNVYQIWIFSTYQNLNCTFVLLTTAKMCVLTSISSFHSLLSTLVNLLSIPASYNGLGLMRSKYIWFCSFGFILLMISFMRKGWMKRTSKKTRVRSCLCAKWIHTTQTHTDTHSERERHTHRERESSTFLSWEYECSCTSSQSLFHYAKALHAW